MLLLEFLLYKIVNKAVGNYLNRARQLQAVEEPWQK